MAKPARPWTVLAPSPFEKLTPHLWRVEDIVPRMPLRRVMAVAKRTDGRLVVHNAICLPDAMMEELAAWGPVAYIVVPNPFHRLDAAAWKARFPSAQIICPDGAKTKVAEIVPVDATFAEFQPDAVVSLHGLAGVRDQEGYMQITEPNATSLVVTDALFNMPHESGVKGFVLKYITASSGGPKCNRIARMMLIKDKPAFAAQLRALAELPQLTRILVGHHETITGDVATTLRNIAATLAP